MENTFESHLGLNLVSRELLKHAIHQFYNAQYPCFTKMQKHFLQTVLQAPGDVLGSCTRHIDQNCSNAEASPRLYFSPMAITDLLMIWLFLIAGHDACVDILLENEEHKKMTGNPFSPLHCAV